GGARCPPCSPPHPPAAAAARPGARAPPRDNTGFHVNTVAHAAEQLHRFNVCTVAAYAARAARPGHLVWSLQTDTFLGTVPPHHLAEAPTKYLCGPDITHHPSAAFRLSA
ncbi:hypothetical protein ACFXO7_33270, partial [Nocardia tengchongensis]|uniref:hypothetical protein n=1 Tax=Nocardia tengchongensis TaxID=2055889 RepID=UPI003698CC09